jgi:hypothetical protein
MRFNVNHSGYKEGPIITRINTWCLLWLTLNIINYSYFVKLTSIRPGSCPHEPETLL